MSTIRFRPWAKTVRWPRERMGSRKLPAPFTFVEGRVIQVEDRTPVAIEVAEQQRRQQALELGLVPLPFAQEAVVGIVRVDAVRIGDVRHARDGAAAGAKCPAGDQGAEESDDGLVKRSAKRPSRRSQATTGGSSGPSRVLAGDAEDIVCKGAPPWVGRDQPSQRGHLSFGYCLLMRLRGFGGDRAAYSSCAGRGRIPRRH